MSQSGRRNFLKTSAALGAGYLIANEALGDDKSTSPNEKVTVGVIGTSGRGTSLAKLFAGMPQADIAYVCDVDSGKVAKAKASVTAVQQREPKVVEDFRNILDDASVDMVVVATPDHWHAPAAILACAAGKHVYVEKPCSHNPREGELLVQAAIKHKRQVQVGTQRRSRKPFVDAIAKLHDGVIGKPLYARAWYYNNRPSIGRGNRVPAPDSLNWDMWQGPATREAFRDNIHPYNWHWLWHWGTGELGNNGVHMIDICRWGMNVDFPTRVTSSGGRYRYKDDQQTPDTNVASFEFADGKMITWEGRSCFRKSPLDPNQVIDFMGTEGRLVLSDNKGYQIYDPSGKEIDTGAAGGGDAPHAQNLLSAIRTGEKLNCSAIEGHKSTLLCHLGNIAWRTGSTLHVDPNSGRIKDNASAEDLWTRDYAPEWEPKV